MPEKEPSRRPTSATFFAEIPERRLGIVDLTTVFPGYRLDEKKHLGLIA